MNALHRLVAQGLVAGVLLGFNVSGLIFYAGIKGVFLIGLLLAFVMSVLVVIQAVQYTRDEDQPHPPTDPLASR